MSNRMEAKGKLYGWLEGFAWGDRHWGYLRLATLVLIPLFVGVFFDRPPRFLLVLLAAVLMPLLFGAHYLQEMYELKSYTLALHYLFAALFGFPAPSLGIDKGKKELIPGKENAVEQIGGPGKLVVKPGSVVLGETPRGPSFIQGAGERLLTRHERVREVFSLEAQVDNIDQITATTKDGIEATLHDLHYCFHLIANRQKGNPIQYNPVDDNPPLLEAVCKAAYNRGVSSSVDGQTAWSAVVRLIIEGAVTKFIAKNTLDKLTAPAYDGADPRGEIRKILMGPEVGEQLKYYGAELVWVDIGRFKEPDKAVDQRVTTYTEKWEGDARVVRAYGEAQRIAYQELGRAEAQAEMLMSITHALDDIGLQGDPNEQLRNLILMRTAQILEAMSEQSLPPGAARKVESGSDEQG